jgi:putative ABC transport system ATP-binding protein
MLIMVTHFPAYAEYVNRVVHLFDGHIVMENNNGKFHV